MRTVTRGSAYVGWWRMDLVSTTNAVMVGPDKAPGHPNSYEENE